MSSKDEFGIDLSCITRYIDDLAKIPSNVRKKAIRSSLKRGNRLLLQSERERLGKLAQSEGKLNQYGTPHSGFLRKGIKGRIKVRNDRVALIVKRRPMPVYGSIMALDHILFPAVLPCARKYKAIPVSRALRALTG